ncbi:MAG: LysM peptidoglycan-binding domain-containing protein [Alicyclobacillaceae bacterium]|nr:LysM peptidoglycan-binding domain-containing protein [Alicyclobacillaceae bacterium]
MNGVFGVTRCRENRMNGAGWRREGRGGKRAAAAIAVLLIVGGAACGWVQKSPDASASGQDRMIVVAEGDTLWSIARRYGPSNADTRLVVDQIRRANHLETSELYPGMILRIPSSP